MNNIINSFMGEYFLIFLVIIIILFVITEAIKKHLYFDKNKRKYTIIKNITIVIQSTILVVALVLAGVSIYSMTLPSQY
ncbi:MAG: hypothetical protein K5866_01035 [Treponema sp.]|jgi:hypothetical protein|nr:hypothetical protein [Treponema sp.]